MAVHSFSMAMFLHQVNYTQLNSSEPNVVGRSEELKLSKIGSKATTRKRMDLNCIAKEAGNGLRKASKGKVKENWIQFNICLLVQ